MKTLWRALALGAAVLAIPGLASAAQARYSARTNGDVVQLRDTRTDTVVSVLTPVSNAYEMVVRGHNVIRMTIRSVDEMRTRPNLNGVPLMSPFANRLDDTAFWANGRKYNFDTEMGNIRSPIPIHGYLNMANDWKVVEARADATGAWVTSKLDFYRNPQYMAQFPFAHTLTMTYKLADGVLEVRTRVDNLANEPMPLSIGFHPYFQLTDSNRDEWTLSVPAQTHWLLDSRNIPTGATEPAANFWGGDVTAIPLSRFSGRRIDDIFTDLPRDAQGRATVSMKGVRQSVSVIIGPKYKTMLVYSTAAPPPPPAAPVPGAPPPPPPPPVPPPVSVGPPIPFSATAGEPAPPERGFVAFEPMVAITNAMNAAQAGTYKDLQSIAPGASWEESFWIKPAGY